MASGDTRAEILIRQYATAPSEGASLQSVNAELNFLSETLSPANYQTWLVLRLAVEAPKASAV